MLICVSFIFISFRVTLPCVVHLLSYVPPNGGNQSKIVVDQKIELCVPVLNVKTVLEWCLNCQNRFVMSSS
jgi:hypothetical protein